MDATMATEVGVLNLGKEAAPARKCPGQLPKINAEPVSVWSMKL